MPNVGFCAEISYDIIIKHNTQSCIVARYSSGASSSPHDEANFRGRVLTSYPPVAALGHHERLLQQGLSGPYGES